MTPPARGRGRPPIPNRRRGHQINLSDEERRTLIDQPAARAGMTASQYVRTVLAGHLALNGARIGQRRRATRP